MKENIPHPFIGFIPRQNPLRERKAFRTAQCTSPDEIPPYIPLHEDFRCPTERAIYLDDDGMVLAQGIRFDGVPNECWLVLARVNGGKVWKWTDRLPAHETRKVVWKA